MGSLAFQDAETIVWASDAGATIYNSYKGTIPGPRGLATRRPTYDHICFESGDEQMNGDTLSVDAELPPAGSVFYYLVNGESWPNCQGTLGTASDGTPRTPLALCPTPPP
jgi:hypothetical protein